MRFNSGLLFCFIMIFQLFGCGETAPENQLSNLKQDEIDTFKKKLIRYIGKKPDDASEENKFNSYFDAHYKAEEEAHQLEQYFADKNGKVYFLFTKSAPSLIQKKVAIAGIVEFGEGGEILVFEEVFRTWKMKPDRLSEVSSMLFTKMVVGDDLQPYYTANSAGVEYIEFPNAEVWYNKEKRKWETSRINPLQELEEKKILETQAIIDSLNGADNAQPNE